MSTDFTKPFNVTLAELTFRPRDNHDAAFIKATAISILTEGQEETLKLAAADSTTLAKNEGGQTDVLDGNGRCEAIKLLINDGVRVKDISILTDGGTFFLPEAEIRTAQTQTASEDFVFLPADFPIRAELALDATGDPQTREETLLATCEFRRGLSMREAVRTVKKIFDGLVGLKDKDAIKYLSTRFGLTKPTIRKYLWIYKLAQSDQDDFFNNKTTFGKLRAAFDKDGNAKPPKLPSVKVDKNKEVADKVEVMHQQLVKGETPITLVGASNAELLGAKKALALALGVPADVVKTYTFKTAPATAPSAPPPVNVKKAQATYQWPDGVEWVRLIEKVDEKKRGAAAFSGKSITGTTTLDESTKLLEVRAVEDSPTEQHYEAELLTLRADGAMDSVVKVANWNDAKANKEFISVCAQVVNDKKLVLGVVVSSSTAPAGKATKKKASKKKVSVTKSRKVKKNHVVVDLLARGDSNGGHWSTIDRVYREDDVVKIEKTSIEDPQAELAIGTVVAQLLEEAGPIYLVTKDGLEKKGDVEDSWDLRLTAADLLGLTAGLDWPDPEVTEPEVAGYDAANAIPSNLPDFNFGIDEDDD